MRTRGLFRTLEDEFIREVDREKQVQQFQPGQQIVTQGMYPWAVFCVHRGTVKLFKLGESGEVQVLRLLGRTDTVGIRPIMADESFAASAQALEKTILCVIPRKTFLRLVRSSKFLALEIMARLARELRVSEDQMMALTQRSVKRRAAHMLLHLDGEMLQNVEGDHAKPISLQKKEIAQMIGTTPETFSRTLAEFVRKGLIQMTRREIRLVDRERLWVVATKGGLYS